MPRVTTRQIGRALAFAALLLTCWLAPGRAAADGALERELARGVHLLQRAEKSKKSGDRKAARSDAREAERLFAAILQRIPTERRAAFYGAQAAVFAEDARAAQAWVERFRSMTPNAARDGGATYLMALVELEVLDRPEVALTHLRRMQALNPQARATQRDLLTYVALDRLGWRKLAGRAAEEAARYFRTAQHVAERLGHNNKVVSARANTAIAWYRAHRYSDAEAVFAALRKEQPEHPLWPLHLALSLGAQSKFPEAIPLYQEAIRLGKTSAHAAGIKDDLDRAHLRLGNAYRVRSERTAPGPDRDRLLEAAQASLHHYIKLAPQEPLGHRWVGTLLYNQLEQPYAAEPFLMRAYELDPMCIDPLRYLLQIHLHYPPPPALGEGEAAAKAWLAPVAAWRKALEEGKEARKLVMDKRLDETGDDGCQ